MAIDKEQPNKEPGKQTNNYMRFSSMGFQMVAIIGLFAYGGYKIDESAHHTVKWATAALSLIGVFISLYLVIRSIKD
jgi:hypothetical protein